METKSIQITCDDGVQLAGELFIPERPKAVVQFNPGTAAKRGPYRKFLTYLAEQGFLCCIYDYRGFGLSREGSLKHSEITYSDFGTKDMPAVKSWLQANYPTLPFLMVAHSAGGQQLGFMPDLSGVHGAITLGVSAAHFKALPLVYRLQGLYFWYGVVPVSNLIAGYVAAARFGIMEDLPKLMSLEWRSWCSAPDSFFDAKFYGVTVPIGHFKSFGSPIHNYHATDDAIATPTHIRTFWKHVDSSEAITFETIRPDAVCLQRLGHVGSVKGVMKDTLWQDIARRLDTLWEAEKSSVGSELSLDSESTEAID